MENQRSACLNGKIIKQEVNKPQGGPGNDLWTDGLIYAFEFVRGYRFTSPDTRTQSSQRRDCQNGKKHVHRRTVSNTVEPESLIDLNITTSTEGADGVPRTGDSREILKHNIRQLHDSHWVPIGWDRIKELVQMVQVDANWASQQICLTEDEDDFTVADVAAPYWERPAGPTWWCHVNPGHQSIQSWLSNAHWLHPAISIALRDESRLISDRMRHLLYEVPVRVAGGLLFELLGQSVGDPFCDEDDIPVVLRSWQAQNFLITALHIKGSAPNINVLGITEVQELLFAGGSTAPKSVHEVIAHLACRLSRWDDRLFRKFIFGAADEIELKFVNRRNHEDLNLLSLILNQEIRRLSTQVIRVKWSLHAREEIVFELLQHLRGINTKSLLEGIKKCTREMLEEQEAVRGRLFTIQDVMQSTVRAWLQDKSLRVTHNLAIFGGCGLVLSIITGLFGINVDGIPGAQFKSEPISVYISRNSNQRKKKQAMAANKFATMLHRNKTPKIAIVLIYTLLEWTLIALLLLNGLFSYLIAALADFFGLKPPCVFCSRVDHVFGPRKSYSDLVCGAHAAEVSRLGYCSNHRKLAEASEMCEDCSSSRPTDDRQVAVLSWMKRSEEGEKDLRCSCCDVALESGFYSPYLVIQPSSLGVLDFAKKGGKLDDDDGGDGNLVSEIDADVENCDDACVKGVDGADDSLELLAPVRVENGVVGEERLVPVELIDSYTLIKIDVSLALATQGDEEEEEDRDYVGYSLVEKDEDTAMDIGTVSDDDDDDDDEEEEKEEEKVALLSTLEINKSQEEVFSPVDHQCEAPQPVSILDQELDSQIEVERTVNYGEFHAPEEDTKVVDAEANCEISIGSEICDHEQIEPPHFNELAISQPACASEQCSASYNVIIIDKEQVTEAEPVEETISTSVNELSICGELNEVEDERMSETPTSIDSLHALHKRFMFERREYGTESLDGSIASEIDGNEILTVDHLKAALKAERKALSALYAELEEERSASAIAANQTMAMITRLQEEKAAMQMEALQYQRMMEEQSEYDQEALQLLNELMMKREKEKQELEKELEVYRKKVLINEAKEMRKVAERGRMNGNGNGNGSGTSSASSSAGDSDELSFESHEGDDCNYNHNESNQNTPTDDVLSSAADQDATKHLLTLDESLTDFEEERISILEQLKALEEKLFSMDDDELKSMQHQHFSNENGHVNGDYEFYGDDVNGGSVNGFEHDLDTNGKLHHRPRPIASGGKRLLPLFDATVDMESEDGMSPNHEMANGSPRSVSKPMIHDHKRLAIAEEVDNVYERLQALEADREFLKHCIRSLKKGDKGMDLLQEILQHLRDLRNVELRVRNAGDALASLSS